MNDNDDKFWGLIVAVWAVCAIAFISVAACSQFNAGERTPKCSVAKIELLRQEQIIYACEKSTRCVLVTADFEELNRLTSAKNLWCNGVL